MDFEGIKMLPQQTVPPSLKHLWLDSAYRGEDKGKDWVQKVLGWSVELVEPPKKPALLKRSYKAWAEEWAKEGIKIDWQKVLPPPKGFLQVLPKRWVVERVRFLGRSRTGG